MPQYCPACSGGEMFVGCGSRGGPQVECPATACAPDAGPPSSDAAALDAITNDTGLDASAAETGGDAED
ncbi:MAG TPA: hypothetical protein VH560_11370 [Polyangia bacterium]|jgi:hypothetical protein|nr:hypothetical protein [Polyangia bacterium]